MSWNIIIINIVVVTIIICSWSAKHPSLPVMTRRISANSVVFYLLITMHVYLKDGNCSRMKIRLIRNSDGRKYELPVISNYINLISIIARIGCGIFNKLLTHYILTHLFTL